MQSTKKSHSGSACKVWDPRTLGQPTHLLNEFSDSFHRSLQDFLGDRLNRRNGPDYKVNAVRVNLGDIGAAANAWHVYTVRDAAIKILIERDLLLSMLDFRYRALACAGKRLGAAGDDASATGKSNRERDDGAKPEPSAKEVPTGAARRRANGSGPCTASEQRLERGLGRALADFCAARIAANAEIADARAPAQPALVIECEICEAYSGAAGRILFLLDTTWQSRLYAQLSARLPTSRRAGLHATSLASQLAIRLTAELADVDIAFGELQRLRPADVLPIRMRSRARVLVENNSIFTAKLADHGGKLCLTSFEISE